MDNSEVDFRFRQQRFSATRAVKYHDYRQRHFKILFDLTVFSSLVLGTLTLYLVAFGDPNMKVYVKLAPAFVVSVINALQMVFRFSDKYTLHMELRKKFQALDAHLKSIELKDVITKEDVSEVYYRRVEIEKQEPSFLRILDLRCHNETCVVLGYGDEEKYDIGPVQGLLARYFDFGKIPSEKGLKTKSSQTKQIATTS